MIPQNLSWIFENTKDKTVGLTRLAHWYEKVRQSGFKVHKLARETKSTVHQTALRVVGQAIASGHMREHSMVASDYAIKVINLQFSNDLDLITKERKWQLEELITIIDTNEQNSPVN